jgi:pyridoxine 5-phosphate synthase
MIRIALDLRPDQATLVPEKEGEVTTEGGLDAASHSKPIASAIRKLQNGGIQVSLFIDPDPAQVDAAITLRAAMIELNTRAFSEACPRSPDLAGPGLKSEMLKLVDAANRGAESGLKILAGHGLTYRNVRLVSDIPVIEELNIGHNIIARASLVGMRRAVEEMLAAMGRT